MRKTLGALILAASFLLTPSSAYAHQVGWATATSGCNKQYQSWHGGYGAATTKAGNCSLYELKVWTTSNYYANQSTSAVTYSGVCQYQSDHNGLTSGGVWWGLRVNHSTC